MPTRTEAAAGSTPGAPLTFQMPRVRKQMMQFGGHRGGNKWDSGVRIS